MSRLIIKNHETSVEINGIDYAKNDLQFQIFYNEDVGIMLTRGNKIIYRVPYDEISLYDTNGTKANVANLNAFKAKLRTFFFRKLTSASELLFISTSGNINSSNVQDALEEVYTAIPNSAKDVSFLNEDTGILATDVHDALLEINSKIGSGEAKDVSFEPITGVTAQDNVQDALEEIYNTIDSLDASVVSFEDGSEDGLEATTVEDAILEINNKVDTNNDFLVVNEYTDQNIPALQKGKEIDFVIDNYNNTYRYKVLIETNALETPYTNPEKFYRISPSRNELEVKKSFLLSNSTSASASQCLMSITYTVDSVNYIAVSEYNSIIGGFRIYNLDTEEQIIAVSLSLEVKDIIFNNSNNKLYVKAGTFIYYYNHVGADQNTLINLDSVTSIARLHLINDSDYQRLTFVSTVSEANTASFKAWRITLNDSGSSSEILSVQLWTTTGATVFSIDSIYDHNTKRLFAVFYIGSKKALYSILIDDNLEINNSTIFTTSLNNFNSFGITLKDNKLYINGTQGIDVVSIDNFDDITFKNLSFSGNLPGFSVRHQIQYVPFINKIVVFRCPFANNGRYTLIYFFNPEELDDYYIYECSDNRGSLFSGVDNIQHHLIMNEMSSSTIKLLKL